MKIGKAESSRVSFGRALTPQESKEYTEVLKEAREKANGGGKSILIVHDSCLPQYASTDTGIGNLSSKSSSDFFDFAKNVLGINTVEVLPPGEIQIKRTPDFYNTYNGSALSLGTQQINLELLTEPRFNSILPKEEFEKVVEANKKSQKAGLVNYENIIGKDSPHEKALRKAFENFRNNTGIDKTAFERFKQTNAEWLDPKAIYFVLREENDGKKWAEWSSETDRTLFDAVTPERTARITQLQRDYASDIEFYKFKQFIADEHLRIGRQNLHEKGMKLFGDCLIGFSDDETWAFKRAFKPNTNVGLEGWEIPALDFKHIKDPKSEAQKLLRLKVGLFAQRYDGIRMDCSWSYIKPKLSDGTKVDEFRAALLEIIEDTVKSVKGNDFDINDIIHEFEADPKDFSIFSPDGKSVVPYLRNRVKVISSSHMGDNYGSVEAMMKLGENPDKFILGVGNHDPQPLRQIAENVPEVIDGISNYKKAQQEIVLHRIFGIDLSQITDPREFSKAKFAEPLMGKNQMVFYMDVFGRKERFDSQFENSWINYRYRISPDYSREYLAVVEDGFGYNPMDAYARVFMKKGLDKTEPGLFEKIIKFKNILTEKTLAIATGGSENPINASHTKKFGWKGIGIAVLAAGLIAGVIMAANKGLQNQRNDNSKINLKA